MRSVMWKSALALVAGMVALASGIAVHAHGDGSAHGPAPNRDLLSISGSPEQLAARSERLALHVCQVIEADTSCPLPALAADAAADLRAFQGRYVEGQRVLHEALIGPGLDAARWQVVKEVQLELLQDGSRRYLRFLADVSASLGAEQKQRFAH